MVLVALFGSEGVVHNRRLCNIKVTTANFEGILLSTFSTTSGQDIFVMTSRRVTSLGNPRTSSLNNAVFFNASMRTTSVTSRTKNKKTLSIDNYHAILTES